LREEHTLRVFEHKVLRKKSGPKREDVTEEWRTLHIGELHDFYTSPVDQIRKNVMGGACGMYRDRRGAYRVLVGKTEDKRSRRRCRRKWVDNIKMDLQEVG
jgi:hypothetical protein